MQKVILLVHINCEIFTWFFIRMKTIMSNRNKIRILLWLFLGFFVWLFSLQYVEADTFAERLYDIWLDINTFSNKNSISRYEVTRLLNAANCEDCVHAPDWMQEKYSLDYWNNFKSIDGKDFNDISYEAWVRNKEPYYYCVAYIWENWYMAWYPSTSTKCKWNFCGQEMITTSEFYQTVLNVIQDQIRGKYLVDWSKVKSRKKWLKKNSMQMKVLNQANIDVINKADSSIRPAQTNDEFQTRLKYCMYNLSACNFQNFWVIWTWYRPVSELNILYKEWIITLDDALKVATFQSIKWEEAIRIFSAVFDNYANCSFNVDYDCDWIANWQDSCPYLFNPNQYDLDWDWIWNVCDEDIDWDWIKNPVWIVDDNNHIIISLRNKDLDETPLWDWEKGFSFFINVDSISTWFPTNVKFSSLSNWNIEKIEWDFWDGNKETVNNWDKITHIFKDYGTFTVKAIATSKNWAQSFAMNKIFIATPKTQKYILNLSPTTLFKNWNTEYTFTPLYSWDIDTIWWKVNGWEEQKKKVSDKYSITVKENWTYVINAKWYKDWEMKAISIFTVIQNWPSSFSNMVIKPWDLWEETVVTSNIVWINRDDVDYISINWWWEATKSTSLVQRHTYNEAWVKTIQQNVVLKDWTTFYSAATITIQNPLLTQSYAMNISWSRLAYNQNEKLLLWLNMYPRTSILSLFTDYQLGDKRFIVNPNLNQSIIDFAYMTAWDKILTNSADINICVSLSNQWTVHINPVDICESLLKNGSISNYKCDMDKDWIPDICDDDIDWDGIKNLIWIITKENKDCSINVDNVNETILKKQIGVCSLDNCPFDVNLDQSDLNNNWVWEVCESSISSLLSSLLYSNKNNDNEWDVTPVLDKDRDGDWVLDRMDDCIDVPWNSSNGCPKYNTQRCRTYSSCWNGKVDEWETCQNCPQDAWVCCWNGTVDPWETCKTCPNDAWECSQCWNGAIEKWENCINCEEDVWECTAFCGNQEIEEAEDCRNCEEDVWKCNATCGNGKIEIAEDCNNCKKDVKLCRNVTCGNWEIDKEAWEECDNWSENGKDNKCTIMCTKYDPNKPKCWNGVIDNDAWEDCKTCPVDLWEKCVAEWEKVIICGNNEIEETEDCRNCEEDVWKCNATCGNGKIEIAEDCNNCKKDVKLCRNVTCGNWEIDKEAWEECDNWSENGKDNKCTIMCTKYDPNKPKCWNGVIDNDAWEDCKTCPVDLWEKCVAEWEKVIICGNNEIDEWEDCNTCPKDVKDWCVIPYNPEIEEELIPEEVPEIEDIKRNIKNENCNTCPCEYADFSTDLTRWDIIRAKLWDKNFPVFYRYSNSVSVESLLDFK